jgi:hypothetical protein
MNFFVLDTIMEKIRIDGDKSCGVVICRDYDPMESSCLCRGSYTFGYVGVGPDHPWCRKFYDNVTAMLPSPVHGDLTYSGSSLPDGSKIAPYVWYIGFDTAHGYENPRIYGKQWCIKEVRKLMDMAEKQA